MKLVMITLEGSADEVSEVGARLGVSVKTPAVVSVAGGGPKTMSSIVGSVSEAPDGVPDAGESSAPSKPSKPTRRRRRTKAEMAAAHAAEAAGLEEARALSSSDSDAESESEAYEGEVVDEDNGEDGQSLFPVAPAELMDAKRLHHVVDRIMKKGYKDVDEIVSICVGLKDEVPLLGRVKDLDKRVRSAYEVAMG